MGRHALLHTASTIQANTYILDVLDLQNNEQPNVIARPYILAAQRRVFHFLRFSLRSTPLRAYLDDSAAVRAVFACDPGNSFGIWQNAANGDSEMFGWRIVPNASYFNHSMSIFFT